MVIVNCNKSVAQLLIELYKKSILNQLCCRRLDLTLR